MTSWRAWLLTAALVSTGVLNGTLAAQPANAAGVVTLHGLATLVPPAATNSFAVARPTGTATSDVMVASLSLNGGGTVTAPAGWTAINHGSKNGVRLWSFYRVATATEPASYTFTSGSSAAGVAAIASYAGLDPLNPLIGSSNTTGNNNKPKANGVPSTTNSVALLLLAVDGSFAGTLTYPSAFTERWNLVNFEHGYGADNLTIASGNLPVQTITLSAPNIWVIEQVALRVSGQPPTVTSVTPSSGSTNGGTSVTVNGTNFQTGATVSFGGSSLTVSSITATSITGTTTGHSNGAVNVTVTNLDTQSGTCNSCFTYVAPAPTVTSVTPSSGPVGGGTSVTVTGTGFLAGAAVSFGGSALSVSNVTATAITGTTTAHASGPVNVVVTNPDSQSGTCSSCFIYIAPPGVSSVTPSRAPAGGGTSVTVAGTGFQTGATVSFGGSAVTVGSIGPTSITGTTAAHAVGIVDVVVSNPDGQSGTCTACFTYLGPGPTIASVAPQSGPTAGGTSITISGTGFQTGATVSFGGAALTVSSVSSTSITGTTAGHTAGAVDVIVTNPDTQTATCSGCFTYLGPAPTVSSVTPGSGSSAGGTSVTVAGSGFQTGATIVFGGASLTVTGVTATSITGTTAAHAVGLVDVIVTNPDAQSVTCGGCYAYTAPAPSIASVSPATGPTAGGTSLTIAGNSFQAGATVSVGGAPLSGVSVTATSITGTTAAHAAGAADVVVTNPDTQSATCAACFTYLAAAPSVSSVTPASGAAAGGTSVTIAGTGFQSGATVSFGGSALTVATLSGTSITGTTTAHTAGAVAITVTNPDTQTGSCGNCYTFLAPAPSIASIAPVSGSSAGGTSVTISGTNFQAGATASFGGSALNVTTVTATTVTGTTTAHTSGTVDVVVTNPDLQSATCTACFTYVAPAPTVTSVAPSAGPAAGGTSVTITGTGFQSGAAVSFGGSSLTIGTIASTSITGTTSAHAVGAVSVTVTNPDAQSGSCPSCYTYVAPEPAPASVAPSSGPAAGGTAVTISGSGFQSGSTASFGGSALAITTVTATSISGTTAAHAAGAVDVVVTNPDTQSGTCVGCYTYVAAPTVTSVTPGSAPAAGGTSVTVNGTGFQSGATVSFGGSSLTVATVSATAITGTTTAHAAGSVSVTVTNPDAQSGSCAACFSYVGAPTVTSVVPISGAAAGGTAVSIAGTGFQVGAAVSFGGSALTVSTVSATSITGTTTAHPAGTVNVVVTNTDAQSATCTGCYTYLAAPTVTSVTPSSGPAAGGTSVTIAGTGFQPGATVSFGGSSVTVATTSATAITGTTTSHAAGAVTVMVTNPDAQSGSCSGCYTYVAAPTVTSVTPSGGPAGGGTAVTIAGAGFQSGATVSLGGSAVSVSTANATSIAGTTSAHATGVVDAVVTNPDTQSGTCAGCYSYVAAPTVTSVTPNSGTTAGGTSVTVAGTGFQPGATVTIGGAAVTVATISAMSISGTTAAHIAGPVDAVVTNTDAQSGTCALCFTYVTPPPPTVSSVTPNSGGIAGGTSVTISGTGFQTGATVSFGGSALTVATIAATTITGSTTAHAAGVVNVVVTNGPEASGTCTGCFTYLGPQPTVSSVTPASGTTAGGTAVTISGTNFQTGATASLGGSALIVSTVTATSISGTTAAHAAGAVNVTVTNPDTQSASCTSCFTYAGAPTVSSVSPTSGTTAGGTSVTISGSGFQSGATVSFGGSALTVATVSATSITGTTSAHNAGAVTVTVMNPDTQSGSCSGCYTYTAPANVTLRATSTASGSGTTYTVAKPAGLSPNDVMVASLSLNASGTVTAPTGWTLIGHTQSVSTVDLWTYYRVAGASEPATYTFMAAGSATGVIGIAAYVGVDPIAPFVAFSSAAADSSGSAQATAPAITTTAQRVALLFLTIDGGFSGTVTYPASFTQRWATVNYERGYAADNITIATGNVPAATITLSTGFFWSIQQVALKAAGPAPAPTVTSVTPNSGSTAGGTSVTIAGSGFQTGATVSFGGSALTVSTVSATSITGTTTAHAAASVGVTVTNTDAQNGTCAACYTYVVPPPPPTVSSVSPNSGPTAGGTSVTVAGSNFQSGATVSFGGSPLTGVSVSPTSITGTTTNHAAATVNVVVTNPDAQTGTCTSCYTYVPAPPPAPTSVTPSSGTSAGGTSVTIAGSAFVTGATVAFGGSALTITTITSTSISGTTTAHAPGLVNVVVTNADAQSGTCTSCYTYNAAPAPTATSVSPNTGTSSGGTVVTITGTNFQSGATVSFAGSAATVSTVTATSISATTPAHAAGTLSVVVTNPDTQAATCANCFTYTGQNAIQVENQLAGDPSWNDFATILNDAAISGYASKISVNHGDSIDLFVTTTAASVSIDVFRTGWYGGVGARKVATLGSFPGQHQAIPLPDRTTGIIDCSTTWTKTTTLNIPASWVTGIYLAKLTASSGNQSFIYFVVRDDGGHEDFAFQTSVTTYQAYNTWGGTSLYNNLTNKSVYTGPHAVKVSFDRPFNPGDSNGAGHYLWYEYPFVRWAESQGLDMTYITDVDTHTNVNPLTNHKAFLSVGHDEYWSKGMRDNVQAAISAGVNVAFFSANTVYWQIRFEASPAGVPNRVEVGYKDFAIFNIFPGPDPMYGVNNAVVTNYWRDTPVNLPENALLGVMYGVQVNADYAYVVQNASHWIYAGTGFVNGQRINGIVGYEIDAITNNGFSPPGLITLSSSPVTACCGGGSATANSTIYTAASGARVFAAGTIQWSWGLDGYGGTTYVNAGIQRTTMNILTNFRGG